MHWLERPCTLPPSLSQHVMNTWWTRYLQVFHSRSAPRSGIARSNRKNMLYNKKNNPSCPLLPISRQLPLRMGCPTIHQRRRQFQQAESSWLVRQREGCWLVRQRQGREPQIRRSRVRHLQVQMRSQCAKPKLLFPCPSPTHQLPIWRRRPT